MDTLTLMIGIYPTTVKKELIVKIDNGKAKTSTGRWYKIVCACTDNDYQPAEPENNVPEAHQVCNNCNRVKYTEDLNE